MTELERLKADLAIFKAAIKIYDRDYSGTDKDALIGIIENKIARLEAEADPWRDAKEWLEKCRETTTDIKTRRQIAFVDHLTAKVEAQRKQIDYLHAEYDNRGLQISELVADNDRMEKRVKDFGDIVRRLADWWEAKEHPIGSLGIEASKLWAEMQRDAKGGGG